MADIYLTRLADLNGLRRLPRGGPFRDPAGAAVGLRQGYLLVLGRSRSIQGRRALTVLVRFRTGPDPSIVQEALETDPGLRQVLDGDKPGPGAVPMATPGGTPEAKSEGEIPAALARVSRRHYRQLHVGSDFVRWDWGYVLQRPDPERVTALVTALVSALRPLAPSFEAACELCLTPTPEISLLNGIPGYHCARCQQQLRQKLDLGAAEYAQFAPEPLRGLLAGLIVMVAAGLAWGLAAYLYPPLFWPGAFVLGLLIAEAVIRGTGKLHPTVYLLIALLTLAGGLLGDSFYLALSLARGHAIALTPRLVLSVAGNLARLENPGLGLALIGVAWLGAALTVVSTRRPRFAIEFTPLHTQVGG